MFWLIALLIFINCAIGKQVSGIFTSFDSLTWSSGSSSYQRLPSNPNWLVTMGWSMKGSEISAGDTFTLNMPCVFKFTDSATSVDLKVGSTTLATCTYNPGEIIVSYSELNCVASSSVTKAQMQKVQLLSLLLLMWVLVGLRLI